MAKRGVNRFVNSEAVRLGPQGARICSVSPGIIDAPQGRQEAEQHSIMPELGGADTASVARARPRRWRPSSAFLLSEKPASVNGVDVLVDGGVIASVLGPRHRRRWELLLGHERGHPTVEPPGSTVAVERVG